MKNLIIALTTIAVIGTFVCLLVAKHNGMHPNFDAFFVIAPLAYLFAVSHVKMIDPVIDREAPSFILRKEYSDYCLDCVDVQEQPWPFDQWFETVYHYEMADEIPTGEPFDGTYASYLASRNAGPIFPVQQCN